MLGVQIIDENKKKYLDLLLLADEQEDMIDKYINDGDMFALFDDDNLKSIAVVVEKSSEACELKNIATYPNEQKKGYGTKLLSFILGYYREFYDEIYVGTGDSDLTIPFYKSVGFEFSHIVENFFVDNYNNPIIENGKQLTDMIYLKKILKAYDKHPNEKRI